MYLQLGSDTNMRYAVDDFATRLLFIDSSRAGASKGWLTDETISWLERSCSRRRQTEPRCLCTTAAAAGNAQMDPIACRKRLPSAGAGGAFPVVDAHLLRP